MILERTEMMDASIKDWVPIRPIQNPMHIGQEIKRTRKARMGFDGTSNSPNLALRMRTGSATVINQENEARPMIVSIVSIRKGVVIWIRNIP